MAFDKSSILSDADEPARRLRALADEACSGGDYKGAETTLVAAITADTELIAHAIRQTAHDEVRMAMAVQRQRISGTVMTLNTKLPGASKAPKVYTVEEMQKVSEWTGKYLSWPLSIRKPLGSATLDEVRAEAQLYEAHAQGNAARGRWFRLIEKRMITLNAKPNEPVGKVLDDVTLGKLAAKARAAVEK